MLPQSGYMIEFVHAHEAVKGLETNQLLDSVSCMKLPWWSPWNRMTSWECGHDKGIWKHLLSTPCIKHVLQRFSDQHKQAWKVSDTPPVWRGWVYTTVPLGKWTSQQLDWSFLGCLRGNPVSTDSPLHSPLFCWPVVASWLFLTIPEHSSHIHSENQTMFETTSRNHHQALPWPWSTMVLMDETNTKGGYSHLINMTKAWFPSGYPTNNQSLQSSLVIKTYNLGVDRPINHYITYD